MCVVCVVCVLCLWCVYVCPVSKWVVIPKLVIGKEIKRDGQAYELLQKLFRLRDKLVHYKTKTKAIGDLRWDEDWGTEDHSRNSIKAVKLILNELQALDPKLDIDWLNEAETDIYA